MSQLFRYSQGQGRPVLLIHGWGMNHQVWQPVIDVLSEQCAVTVVDLPGHGRSADLELSDWESVLELLEPLLTEQMTVMGWSLGGLVAQKLAIRYPEKVTGLVMVASNPSFVAHESWSHGLPVQVLDDFASNLQQDYQATVKRFFALQFMGARTDPAVQNALRDRILAFPATLPALATGLRWLKETDLVSEGLAQQPTQWILGRLDKLTPASLATAIPEFGSHHQLALLPRAAHVPFVTHPDEFLQTLSAFWESINHAG